MKNNKPLILISEDVLKGMFEGSKKGKAKELLDMMKRIKDGGGDMIVRTPMSHFLRALWLCDPKTRIQNIQKVLSFTQIIPSFADFKNEKQCVDELLIIAKVYSGGENE